MLGGAISRGGKMSLPLSSSTVSGISVPSPSFLNARDSVCSSPLFNFVNCLRSHSAEIHSSRTASWPWFSRKLFKVRATLLQENEEKVVVEEAFNPNSFPAKEGNASSGVPPDGLPYNGVENWIIKIEHSINIFFTEFKLFYDVKFGRKSEAHTKNTAANGQTVPRNNSLKGTSYGNGHVKNTADLAIYDQFQNQDQVNSLQSNGVPSIGVDENSYQIFDMF